MNKPNTIDPKATNQTPHKQQAENYSATNLGALDNLHQYTFSHEALPVDIEGKIFLNQLLDLSSAEISLNRLEKNSSMPFFHKHHKNEEIYIFIKGKGEIQIDDDIIPIQEGSVVRIAPEGVRCWRSLDESLHYIVIQAPVKQYTNGETISDGEGVDKVVNWS